MGRARSFLGPLGLLLALVAVVLAPILLRRTMEPGLGLSARNLIILTPHTEAIRYEFSRAFEAAYLRKTGERVRIDWRTPGGTSEIARFVESRYLTAFQHYWEDSLHRPWSGAVARGLSGPAGRAGAEVTEQEARRAFLESSIGCGADLLFGGGAFEFAQHAEAGRLVESGLVSGHPELFGPGAIPQTFRGEPFWDPRGRWVGTCLDAFGICSNGEALRRLGIAEPPRKWADLADPRLRRQLALANPTQSSSVNKAFEMLIQQQIAEAVGGRRLQAAEEATAIARGWSRAMQLLMRLGANARYFSDASSKIALDVAAGEAAAGTTIGLYGRFQSENLRRPDGTSRLLYSNAEGGTSYGADPIGLLRGAPNPELARAFMEWVLSPEGQKLWNLKASTPGGPERYALRRLPILPALYGADLAGLRSDPEVNPYKEESGLTYHAEWTGDLFRPIAFIVRVMCIEPHTELSAAWEQLAEAGFPARATQRLLDVEAVNYAEARGRIRSVLRAGKMEEIRLAKELAAHFREQYRQAEALTRDGR